MSAGHYKRMRASMNRARAGIRASTDERGQERGEVAVGGGAPTPAVIGTFYLFILFSPPLPFYLVKRIDTSIDVYTAFTRLWGGRGPSHTHGCRVYHGFCTIQGRTSED